MKVNTSITEQRSINRCLKELLIFFMDNNLLSGYLCHIKAIVISLCLGTKHENYIYSQLLPCGHPTITDTPILAAAKSYAKIINCIYVSLIQTPTIKQLEVPIVSTLKEVDCTKKTKPLKLNTCDRQRKT